MRKYKNYIFDLDGTLINSSEEVLLCFKKAFQAANFDIDESRFTSDVIGPPLKQILEILAPNLKDESKLNEIITNFRQIYDYDENDISIMYDGIYNLLVELKNKRYKLFIATFKPKIPTMRLIKKFKLDKLFDDIYTIDKFGKKITKEEMITNILSTYGLQKSETVMIGDTPSDMTAAKNAGINGIGVLWGYGNDKSQLINNADFVVNNIEELKDGRN